MRRQKLKDEWEGYELEYELKEDNNLYEVEYMETMREYIEFYAVEEWSEILIKN